MAVQLHGVGRVRGYRSYFLEIPSGLVKDHLDIPARRRRRLGRASARRLTLSAKSLSSRRDRIVICSFPANSALDRAQVATRERGGKLLKDAGSAATVENLYINCELPLAITNDFNKMASGMVNAQ